MKNYWKALAWIILLFCIPFASALQERFEAYPSSKTMSVCSCGVGEDALLVQNTGDLPSNYELKVDGDAKNWVTYTQKQFTLQPGEMKKIPLFANVPCDGTKAFSFTTIITTSLGLQQQVQQQITLQDCLSFSINPLTDFQQSGCPCHPLQYDFSLSNNADGPEVFDLRVEPKEYALLSEDQVVLGKNEQKTISVFVNLPCDQSGTFSYDLYAVAEHSRIEGKHPFVVDSLPCYGYAVAHQDSYTLCGQVVNTFPVTVENTQDIANVLSPALKGVSWAKLNERALFLGPHENTTILAVLDPEQASPGNYTAILSLTPQRGQQVYEKNINLGLEDCFDAKIIPPADIPTIVGCEQSSYGVLVNNNGTKQAKLAFGLDAPPFVSLDRQDMVLEPGQQGFVQQQIDAPCDIAGQFATSITVQFADIPAIGRGLMQQFNAMPFSDAYRIAIKMPSAKVGFEPKEMPITITNNGIRDAVLDLSLQAPQWAGLNMTRIIVPVNSSVSVSLVTQPGETEEEAAYPAVLTAQLVNPYNQQLSFVQEFEIRLQKHDWLLIGLAAIPLILILAGIAYFVMQQKPGRSTRAKVKAVKAQKQKAMKVKPLKASLFKEKLHSFEEHVTLRLTPKFWKILAAVVLILLLGLATFFLSPIRKQAPVTETGQDTIPTQQLITFGEGVNAQGNVISITKKSDVPVTITNTEDALTYDISAEFPDWITADTTRLVILPHGQGTMTLTIDPETVEAGEYPLTFKIGIQGTAESKEETVIVKIIHVKAWQYYVLFSILGLVALLVIITLLRKREQKDVPSQAPVFRQSAAERLRQLSAKVPAQLFTWEKMKRWLWFVIPIFIILLLLGLYFGTSLFRTTVTEKSLEEQFNEQAAGKEHAPEQEIAVGEETARQLGVDDRGLVIPLKIRNDNPELTYRISVQKSVDWITPDKELIEIPPLSAGEVNLAVSPDRTVAEGKYHVEIGVTIGTSEQLLKQTIILDYQKRWWKHLLEWIISLLIGIGIVVGVVYWWKWKKTKQPMTGVELR